MNSTFNLISDENRMCSKSACILDNFREIRANVVRGYLWKTILAIFFRSSLSLNQRYRSTPTNLFRTQTTGWEKSTYLFLCWLVLRILRKSAKNCIKTKSKVDIQNAKLSEQGYLASQR